MLRGFWKDTRISRIVPEIAKTTSTKPNTPVLKTKFFRVLTLMASGSLWGYSYNNFRQKESNLTKRFRKEYKSRAFYLYRQKKCRHWKKKLGQAVSWSKNPRKGFFVIMLQLTIIMDVQREDLTQLWLKPTKVKLLLKEMLENVFMIGESFRICMH